jgi:hypothetical protein
MAPALAKPAVGGAAATRRGKRQLAPVIRVFGPTSGAQKCCLYIHGVSVVARQLRGDAHPLSGCPRRHPVRALACPF